MLTVVTIVCLAVAVGLVVYAFLALPSELAAQKEVKKTAAALGESIKADPNKPSGEGLGGKVQEQALLTGGTDFVKALASLGDSMSKLKSGTSALLIAFGLLIFAGFAAGVDDKVADAKDKTATTTVLATPTTTAP